MLLFIPLTTHVIQQQAEPSIVYTTITLVLGLLVAVVALAIIAPRLKLPYPILLVLGGLLLGFIPGLPNFTLEPDLVFLLFLPPLLYSSAWFTSWRDFRANLRSISLLAIGLVLVTTVVIAFVAHLLIPNLPLAAAFVLGAIISPTDAVAATSIAQRLGIPRRIITILEGESLVNDASGLVAYQFAIAAVVSGTFSLSQAGLQFIIVSVGGVAIGLILGWGLNFLHHALENPPLQITVTLLTPFVAYLLADEVFHVSGVLATVTTGLFLTWRAPDFFSSEVRQQALAVWGTFVFLLNGLVFILIGLQLRTILDDLNRTLPPHTVGNLLWYAVVISLTTIVVRILWVLLSIYLPYWLGPALGLRDPKPKWRNVLIVAWTGMRGVVSLAAALAIPVVTANQTPFPQRALIIYLTFSVILATLVLQGLSLPFLIRWLGLKDDGTARREEATARLAAIHAALERIDALVAEGEVSQEVAEHLRKHYEARLNSITTQADATDDDLQTNPLIAYQYLQQAVLKAEYQAVVQLRNEGEINDVVLRRIEQELDLEQQQLKLRQ